MMTLMQLKKKILKKVEYSHEKHGILYGIYFSYQLFRYFISCLYHFVRTQSQITRMLGPQYKRSDKFIEIDITYRCNLKCPNCNRSCTQAPSREEITIDKIKLFVEESISQNFLWEQINILGGEPTLHSHFYEILDVLLKYKNNHNPAVKLHLITNGFGKHVQERLLNVPNGIVIRNTFKLPGGQIFTPFNMAPIDSKLYKNSDFSSGCKMIENAGMGLTPYGYYPCAIAGGIDRVLDLDGGREHLPMEDDLMSDQLNKYCRYCGHFGISIPTKKEKISPTWERVYMLRKMTKKNRG
jgi:hypothetical protein